jgi:phosphoglycolate phosphatase-like HAD superfamily hydrolase
MADAAVIFDVDGVLLELTSDEEDVFFEVFEKRYGLKGLSRDWNSYRIRNDENIIEEILEKNNIPFTDKFSVISDYIMLLKQRLDSVLKSQIIFGVAEMLERLHPSVNLGIATANFRDAAKLRLEQVNIWPLVKTHAFGAEGGGHKREILARAISSLNLPKSRIVYVGDNVNDVSAGLSNNVHFIGFSTNTQRMEQLRTAGAIHTSNNHDDTYLHIAQLLYLNVEKEHN